MNVPQPSHPFPPQFQGCRCVVQGAHGPHTAHRPPHIPGFVSGPPRPPVTPTLLAAATTATAVGEFGEG